MEGFLLPSTIPTENTDTPQISRWSIHWKCTYIVCQRRTEGNLFFLILKSRQCVHCSNPTENPDISK
uniref:Uncharacterized protein n=1 Tax=Mus spicilegus TaxID=10103 RepID=A0A8C6IEY3_MUSSI